MTMLPGRQKPIRPRAASIAALAWAALRSSGAGIVLLPGSPNRARRVRRLAGVHPPCRIPQCIRCRESCRSGDGTAMGDPAAQAGGGPRRRAVAATALRGLSRFGSARGIPEGPEFLLDYDVIEAFCVAGLRRRLAAPAVLAGRARRADRHRGGPA